MSSLGFAVEKWNQSGLWVICRSDPDYPSRLKEHLRDQAPPILYGAGDRALLPGCGLAIVGSRDVDEAGHVKGRNYQLYFWRSYDANEVDLLFESAEGFIAIVIKASERWDKRYNRGLRKLQEELGTDRTQCHGIYLGQHPALWDKVHVWPVPDFLEQLWSDNLFS